MHIPVLALRHRFVANVTITFVAMRVCGRTRSEFVQTAAEPQVRVVDIRPHTDLDSDSLHLIAALGIGTWRLFRFFDRTGVRIPINRDEHDFVLRLIGRRATYFLYKSDFIVRYLVVLGCA